MNQLQRFPDHHPAITGSRSRRRDRGRLRGTGLRRGARLCQSAGVEGQSQQEAFLSAIIALVAVGVAGIAVGAALGSGIAALELRRGLTAQLSIRFSVDMDEV